MTKADRFLKGELDGYVAVLLIVALYYESYRYPFQLSVDSPASLYSAPPSWLQTGKYVVVAFLLACWFIRLIYDRPGPRVRNPWFVVIYSYLLLTPIYYGILLDNSDFVLTGFFFSVPLLLHCSAPRRVSFGIIRAILVGSILLAIVADTIQILAFLLWGRLPALSIPGTLLVRFGSFLDDPNGFCLIAILFLGFSVQYWNPGLKRTLIIAALLLCILLTQSLTSTASAMFAMSVFGVALFVNRRGRVKARTVLAGVVFVWLLAVLLMLNWGSISKIAGDLAAAYSSYSELKAQSISEHLQGADALTRAGWTGMTGLSPWSGQLIESGYIYMSVSFGLLYPVTYLTTLTAALLYYGKRAVKDNVPKEDRAISAGAFCFLTASATALIGLPFEKVYPVNFVICTFLGLASSGVLGRTDRYYSSETMQNSNRPVMMT